MCSATRTFTLLPKIEEKKKKFRRACATVVSGVITVG